MLGKTFWQKHFGRHFGKTRMLLKLSNDPNFDRELQKYRHDVKCIKTNPLPIKTTTNMTSTRLSYLLSTVIPSCTHPHEAVSPDLCVGFAQGS